ncbi:hypothetical protein FNV43_RR24543 [Rhamnella rubrinervis]|uniref:Protein EARLY FLOWERING 4 domain-containing protein n=1 Tax=Rhamnella rubrinervis TaxID=2594499 RepID=A0A8K0DRD9_9ROSA|nr:hypothetical protein FNV43_RR24543 [Rhamnella rubrinervis]
MHMTTLDSSTSTESSMDDAANHHRPNLTKRTRIREEEEEDDVGDEVWQSFNSNFHEVQSVLDRNRSLIQQVNENHQSRLPDNMVKNVALIHELNGNISKVVSLYSDLSSNFSSYVHEHQRSKNGKPETPPQR